MSVGSRNLAAIAAVLAVGLLAACSDEGGFELPGQGGPSDPAQSGSQIDVPKVAEPLRADPFLKRPCDLVDEKTVAEIGDMKPPEADADSERARRLVGPSCAWFSKETGPRISVAIQVPTNKASEEEFKGIAGVYYGHQEGLTDYLEPTEIPGHPGYPAVFSGQNSDKEPGKCPLILGISDDLTVAVAVTDLLGKQDTCPGTLKVAASVLSALKTGG